MTFDSIGSNINLSTKVSKPIEFGDFQTPADLAARVCLLLSRHDREPASLIEPTCGAGNFLIAALDQFPGLKQAIGVEIDDEYVRPLRERLERRPDSHKIIVIHESFFHVDWKTILDDSPEPILVVGNPPWVTNSTLGSLRSSNLPAKTNLQKLKGLAALTGKSNFDISEWMIVNLLDTLAGRNATIALLCKTAVARKALAHAWRNNIGLAAAEIHAIDAAESFGAAVDACLLLCRIAPVDGDRDCHVYQSLGDANPSSTIGYRDGTLVADAKAYDRWKYLSGDEVYKWRSGVKHDCSRVIELKRDGERYSNGFGEIVEIEDDYLYPMLKSSEIAAEPSRSPSRRMIVTQKSIGDDPSAIRSIAPKTWDYLQRYADLLDKRASSIYRNRPRFSIFGVGPYTFSPWKVAISGFYKRLRFAVIAPCEGKPVVLDDTAYFTACESERDAQFIADLLNNPIATAFFSAFVFWDSKRPITIEILRRLDLRILAQELHRHDPPEGFAKSPANPNA